MKPLKIILADAQYKFVKRLSVLLNSLESVEIIGVVTNSKELFQLLTKHPCKVLTLDLERPNTDVLELTSLIKKKYPHVHILLLSLELKTSVMMDALQAGASAYLLKTIELTELHTAVTHIAKGQVYVGDYIIKQLVKQYHHVFEKISYKPIDVETRQLSVREKQILELISYEYSNNEIAGRLFISPSTVETHRKQIKNWVYVTLLVLAKYALRIGLISLD